MRHSRGLYGAHLLERDRADPLEEPRPAAQHQRRDVELELVDETRREALFEVLIDLGAQAFMTGTDEAVFAPLGDAAQRVWARDGRIELEAA